jgi:hypothetical protein
MSSPRKGPSLSEEPNLGQKEAHQEKTRFEDEEENDESEDELEPMEKGSSRDHPPSHPQS